MSDTPGANGEYNVVSPSGIPIGTIDAATAQRIKAQHLSNVMTQSTHVMTDAAVAGYKSTGVDEAVRRAQSGWTTMILTLLWRTIRYYFRAVVKGPMGDRIGVIASWGIGIVLMGSVAATPVVVDLQTGRVVSEPPNNDLFTIGALILLFGGLILGPLGGFIGRMLGDNSTPDGDELTMDQNPQ